jgi:hypothetical protein
MKVTQLNKRSVLQVATTACLLLAGALSAFAIPPNQVARFLEAQTITGKCCFLFGSSVSVVEPAAVAPVVVTFTTDYQNNSEPFAVGLSVNGTPCSFYGNGSIPVFSATDQFANGSFQSIVFPSNGLVQGRNTFQLCGGGELTTGAHITLGFNTLVVQLSK